MPAASRNAITETFFKVHPWIYRKTKGRVLGSFGGAPILLLNTRGRKSGLPRTNGLVYLDRGNSWAIAASWAGEPKHPIWYLNLMANPDVTIQVKDRTIPVRARELEGEERDRVWQDIVAQDPGFAEYENRTRGIRKIPVVLLEPRPQATSQKIQSVDSIQSAPASKGEHTMYGLSCSYFTGKLEAYFKAKGIPFRFVEMTRGQFRACGKATGIIQLPCVQKADGTWLTDTTSIIEHFEAMDDGPPLRPADPAAAFCSLLFEDLFDEWFWRPALYYRWAFNEDAKLMSSQLGRTMLRDVPLPLFLRAQFILRRQRIVYLKKDGVTKKTAPKIEALYMDTLRALDRIFARRPYLLGDRPSEADFGLFGPFFRHFFCDPTPGALMRKHAPHLTHWVTRLWTATPADIDKTGPVADIPDDLGFFFDMVANDYLPYLEANAQAVSAQGNEVRYESQGVEWNIPPAPYRVECLNALKRRFAALDPEAADRVAKHLPAHSIELLKKPATTLANESNRQGLRGRLWRPAGVFD